MKTRQILSLSIVVLLFTLGMGTLFSASAPNSNYGHITFVDKATTIIRQDKTEQKAEVNMPVAPGDMVVTSEDSRCEIQFDNGTVLRLDKKTHLRVTTIMAPTLTSNKKITTLHLTSGQVYAMIQSYNREMFQVITPNAAVEFNQRTAATIQVRGNGETFVYTDKGKCHVMFGEDLKSLKTETARSGKGYTISATHQFSKTEEKRDIEFLGWNEYVNNHFNELHKGISVVPKQISRYSKGVIYWAEKWSSLYGEWIYDDLFGYVWKPADEVFAFSKRPFFHANFVRMNNELFLVPQEPWGWAPAHLGTWVWMKWGWTWIPGDAFSSGVDSMNSFCQFNTLDYWINSIYGNYDLYYEYRRSGEHSWRRNYRATFHRDAPKIEMKRVPDSIRSIIKGMNRTPVTTIQSKLGTNRPTPLMDREKLAPYLKTDTGNSMKATKNPLQAPLVISQVGEPPTRSSVLSSTPHISRSLKTQAERVESAERKAVAMRGMRDFNPDIRWAAKEGYKVHYNSNLNAMVCPSLNINSLTITPSTRSSLHSFYGNANDTNHYRDGYNNMNNTNSTPSDRPNVPSVNIEKKANQEQSEKR